MTTARMQQALQACMCLPYMYTIYGTLGMAGVVLSLHQTDFCGLVAFNCEGPLIAPRLEGAIAYRGPAEACLAVCSPSSTAALKRPRLAPALHL